MQGGGLINCLPVFLKKNWQPLNLLFYSAYGKLPVRNKFERACNDADKVSTWI